MYSLHVHIEYSVSRGPVNSVTHNLPVFPDHSGLRYDFSWFSGLTRQRTLLYGHCHVTFVFHVRVHEVTVLRVYLVMFAFNFSMMLRVRVACWRCPEYPE